MILNEDMSEKDLTLLKIILKNNNIPAKILV